MVHRTLVRAACTALVALSVAGCADYGPSDPGPILRVDPSWATIEPTETRQLTVTLDGEPTTVTWESSNPAVATVSATGLVTGIRDGYTAVTATSTVNPSLKISSSITVPLLQGTQLTSGVGVGISGTARGQALLFRIRPPAGSTNLRVTISGGTGDVDLYVRRGAIPTGTVYDCGSENGGNDEVCNFPNPANVQYYIRAVTWDPYAGATITATVTP